MVVGRMTMQTDEEVICDFSEETKELSEETHVSSVKEFYLLIANGFGQ